MDETTEIDYRQRFAGGTPFPAYLDEVRKNEELWRAVWERAKLPPKMVEEARELGGTWHLLALSEDWCGDAVNTLPVLARFAEAVPGWELRVLARDENPDIMDEHLTDGRARSIPVVMLFDEDFVEQGWWGPRPTELQRWVLDNLSMASVDRYREVRRWYARDRGRTVVREVLDLAAAVTSAV